MRDVYGLLLSELRHTMTYGIGRLLYDWNNLILLWQNQHKRIHKTPSKSFINGIFSEAIASLASMVVTALDEVYSMQHYVIKFGSDLR